ncbi:SusC/RagA family TonB-linked outer membrane protein [Hymenobacter sp. BT18]|uniref:SusC/RagA family TonB-linked outer membrane protein n=1 Tax=Hymenobacter sp. BT18 TaxID=2835648 RepID=UPI00143E6401|nr:SusC/RagA family TonB-linked outer membrane protein [Hymenobacter sp. BT18]QIX60724.1 SusC/RagA family TonB-linked outer membrane protein [Hymenobacter sp. BT18]
MKKLLLLSFLFLTVLLQQAVGQERTVSGRVTDRENNQGLPGVTVLVKGTTVGASTNSDGTYSLSIPSTATTLQFSFVGYRNIERVIGNSSTIDVALEVDTKQLNEVVVTALGVEREKKALGYSTTTISAEQVTQGRDRSVLNSLQGKVAGVQISNASGGVGSSTRVVIRGNKSLLGNNQPLYVVDGIPISNDAFGSGDNLNNGVDAGNRANDVNPDDVESVNILKGPAATALYGTRAANGAIVITTKSGRGAAKRGKKAEVTYTTSYTLENILKLPDFQNEFGQGTSVNQPDTRENWSWGPRFDGQVRIWGQVIDGQQRVKPYVAQPDNVKDFFDTGKTYTNSISVGGGNEKSNYLLSLSNTNQKGITPTTQYQRTSVKVSGESKLTNKITSSANLTYTRSGGDLAVTGQGASVYDQIIQTPRDINLLELKDLNNKFNTLNGYYGAYTTNPWQILDTDFYRNEVDRIFGNFQLGYDISDRFKVTYRLGTDVYSDRRQQFSGRRQPVGQNSGASSTGRYAEAQYAYQELNSDLVASYNKDLTPDLNLNVLAGHNVNQRRLNPIGFETTNVISNDFQSFDNNRGLYSFTENGGRFLRRLMGVYATADLSFRDYLFLGVTGRNDWSSTLPTGNNSFFYPGVNAGFVFTEALGMQDNAFFNYGKLRAAYAQAGNDAAPYQTASVFTTTNPGDGFPGQDLQFPLNGIPAFQVGNQIGNPNLKPEITKSLEFGTEFRFFNNRLTFDATYYDARSTNQIFSVPISSASGFTSRVINAGELRNRGIELLLGATPVKVGDFTWDVSVNFTKNKNEVVDLFEGTNKIIIGGLGGTSLTATKGRPYGDLEATYYEYAPDGKIIVAEATGLPINSAQQVVRGNINPDFLAGLNTSFSFKGANLSLVFDTKQGGEMYSRTRDIQWFVGTDPLTLYNNRQPFVVPNSVVQLGDGSYAPNTTPVAVYDYWGQAPTGTAIIDASYVKFREASLSYSIPTKWLNKTPFGSLSLGVTGRNLYLWTAKENTYVDPESNNFGNGNVQGFDFTGSPSTRSFGANLKVTF